MIEDEVHIDCEIRGPLFEIPMQYNHILCNFSLWNILCDPNKILKIIFSL